MKLLRNILAALIFAGLGVYVLWYFKTVVGLGVGVGAILIALGIALPTQLHDGVLELKANLVLIVPVIQDALSGGRRKSDPPEDPPAGGAA